MSGNESEEQEEQAFYEHYRFQADPGQELLRIDKWLMNKLANASRTRVQQAAEAGSILVNGNAVKSNYRIKPGDVVSIILPDPPQVHTLIPENIPLDIVYEDDSLLVVNKPDGMVVHPGYNNYSGTLVNALVFHFENLPVKSESHRPGLVHRIDKDTSGLLVIAKSEFALSFLAKQFFDHTINRHYTGLVWGDIGQDEGTVTGFLTRDNKDRRRYVNTGNEENGKWAVTHYSVLERFGFATLLQLRLETGRTHQIRAQMASIRHPLFNDTLYGGAEVLRHSHLPKFRQFIENHFNLLQGQALHAASLGFIHPDSRQQVYFEAPLPAAFSTFLEKLRTYTRQ
jgi:23S rRNA pseudouridine1911/1915/1917 synthase